MLFVFLHIVINTLYSIKYFVGIHFVISLGLLALILAPNTKMKIKWTLKALPFHVCLFVFLINIRVCTKLLHFPLVEARLDPTFIFVQLRSRWGTKWFMNIPIPQLFLSLTTFIVAFKSSPFLLHFPATLSLYYSSFTSFSPLKNLSSNLHFPRSILHIGYPDIETRHNHDMWLAQINTLLQFFCHLFQCLQVLLWLLIKIRIHFNCQTKKNWVRETAYHKTLFYHKGANMVKCIFSWTKIFFSPLFSRCKTLPWGSSYAQHSVWEQISCLNFPAIA